MGGAFRPLVIPRTTLKWTINGAAGSRKITVDPRPQQLVVNKLNFKVSSLAKMVFGQRVMLKTTVCLLMACLLVLAFTSGTEATYRKPPFNGSIFGKRGSPGEYDTAGKALSAMCEIANEACQSWFPNQENK
ncbi:neuropeptide IMFamide-like [Arctopsyche grandis]|uniref:neuropeptide IMFamide-like n=1 Tax=Arctopsyche grandis TaxID=121162 RepID=UPI00406D660B